MMQNVYLPRLQRLRNLLMSMPCDGLIIEHPTHLFYLTGILLSAGKMIVTMDQAFLIVDGRYLESSSKQTLYPVELLKEGVLKQVLHQCGIHRLGFDQYHTTYHNFQALSKLSEELHSSSSSYSFQILPVDSVVQQLRLIKDEEEISCLRKAAHLGYRGYEFVVSLLREGITEKELAFELEFFWKKKGASRLAFDPIIAFGPNSSMPHYRAGDDPLHHHSFVLIDIGVVLSHYHSDMTRVVFFDSPSPIMQKIYAIVEEAKAKALELCRPGNLIGDLDRVARGWITDQGYGEYFTHSLGHGIGLDIHESPTIREKGADATMVIQPGMVFTIEPGIYLPKIGGVRLEDTILITDTGYENLCMNIVD